MLASISYGTYIFFAFFCGLAGVWALTLLPETKGRTLEQMYEAFCVIIGLEYRNVMMEVVGATRRASVHKESLMNV